MYSRGGSNNSFYGNKDSNNFSAGGGGGGGQKKEIKLLSCIMKEMGSSASSAQQSYRRSQNASPNQDKSTISCNLPFLSCKSSKLPPIKPYNEYSDKICQKQNEDDRSFEASNLSNKIFDAELIDNAESNVIRDIIGSPSYKNSLILKMLCKTASESNMNVDLCTDTVSACGTISGKSQKFNQL